MLDKLAAINTWNEFCFMLKELQSEANLVLDQELVFPIVRNFKVRYSGSINNLIIDKDFNPTIIKTRENIVIQDNLDLFLDDFVAAIEWIKLNKEDIRIRLIWVERVGAPI